MFSAAVLVFILYVNHQRAQREVDQSPAATTPDERASTKLTVAKPSPPETKTPQLPAASPPESPTVEQPPPETTRVEPPAVQPTDRGPSRKVLALALDEEVFSQIGSVEPESKYTFSVELSNRGAAVQSVKLANHFATIADKRRYQKDPRTYETARLENPKKYRGHYSVLNPTVGEGTEQYLPMASGKLVIRLEGEPTPIESRLDRIHWWRRSETSTEKSQSAVFEVEIHSGATAAEVKPLLKIVKTYTVTEGDYSIAMSLGMENLSGKRLTVTLDQGGPTGLPQEDRRQDLRQAAYAYLQEVDSRVQVRLKDLKELGGLRPGRKVDLGSSGDPNAPLLWVGHVNKFFGSMMYLKPSDGESLQASEYNARFYVIPTEAAGSSKMYLTSVQIPDLILESGESKNLVFDIFAGPKKRSMFTDADADYFRPLYANLNYIGTIDLGGCFCLSSKLLMVMMWLLDWFSRAALGNYGVAIIILVLLVRLVLHPLTKKSQVSMMRMQKLSPQVQKLKEKYPDDKNTLNKEMMKLYKQQGASPLLSFLPMLLQLPLWIALFRGLNAIVELRHAAFLPFWITDLAAPDALFNFPNEIPYVGPSFNLLPILLAISMFIQQKFTPQSSQATASPEQAQTQKMMKYMLPGMMIVFFYHAPSGLTLYIMTSTFAGILDSYFVRKHIREKEAAEAAEQTFVSIPGKAARSARPKKPKGPFWIKRG